MLQSKVSTIKALIAIMGASTMELFRAKVLACLNDKNSFKTSWETILEANATVIGDKNPEFNKRMARKQIVHPAFVLLVLLHCGTLVCNILKLTDKVIFCAGCKAVSYCHGSC